MLKDQNSNEENRQPSSSLTAVNELKTLNPSECEMVSLDKHKLEVEQRVNITSKNNKSNRNRLIFLLEIFRRTVTTS